ncbi:HPF/RaiA family ribosome-associated protein [Propionivibrio limicola]|uniref:HPF/RaiA family ribosome-associated protein n=1 Tax=Propionivibrio limicola TaxID=167645 RepID=UPI00129094AF|nr:HPF/RaiA family ribosome-associated protein [Propionivibrio limicola]
MRVDIKTSGIDLTDGLREHAERRLTFALDRARHDVSSVTVRLSDINGPKGGNDKRCQIQIPLPHHRDVLIEDTASDLYVAIDRAIGRIGNTLGRRLSRQRADRRQPRHTQETAFEPD